MPFSRREIYSLLTCNLLPSSSCVIPDSIRKRRILPPMVLRVSSGLIVFYFFYDLTCQVKWLFDKALYVCRAIYKQITIMNNLSIASVVKRFSITFLLLFVFGQVSAQTVTNSSCFTLSVTTSTAQCSTNMCDEYPNDGQCTYCYEVTVTNTGCSGLTINRLTMTTPGDNSGDCRAICSPTNDFFPHLDGETNSITECSWAGPRYLEYLGNGGNGLPYLGTAKFIICRKAPLNVPPSLTYTFSCGCSCGGTPCTNATITF